MEKKMEGDKQTKSRKDKDLIAEANVMQVLRNRLV